uniref:Tetratricopeptide repeat protein 29 n=2 Tax=Parascaris TaxID=6254 RepID=A0A915BKD3_PARUN
NNDELVQLVKQAGGAYSRGELQLALHLYERAVLIDPTNHVLYSNRAAILCRLGRFEESLQQAEHSIRLNPKWAKAYLRKGDSLKGAAKLEKAMLAYCKGLTVDRNNTQLLNALIQCVYASPIRDKFCSLMNSLESANVGADAFIVVSGIGQELLALGNNASAISMLNAALEIDTDCLQLRHSVVGALSRAHYESGHLRKALDYLDIQLEIAEQLEDVNAQLLIHDNIAKIAFIEDELTLAVIHVRREIELKCKRGEETDGLYETLGGLLMQMGEYDEAEIAFAKTKSVTVDCLVHRAKVAIAKKELTEAIGYCDEIERVSECADKKAIAAVIRCKCLLIQSDARAALQILRSVTTQFSTDEPSAHMMGLLFGMLSECHLAVGQHYGARKWARKQLKIAIGISSRTLEADALRNLSQICEAIDDYENALTLWIKYDQLVQDDTLEVRLNSLNRLASLNEACANNDEAECALLKRLALTKKVASPPLLIDAHSSLTRFYRLHNNKEQRKKHFEALRELFDENGTLLRESVVLEDSADFKLDAGDVEEALIHYEKCLMLVQEDGDIHREAEVCSKLAAAHWRLFHSNEAVAYYEHSLAVYQQLANIRAMMRIYANTAKIHMSTNALQQSHSCLRYCLTLAGFLGDDGAKLDALLQIGRLLTRQNMFAQAKKVLSKALDVASIRQRRRELGLIYGYMAECYIGFGNMKKAMMNFCKQLRYFDDIEDPEGKCETLRHLIEEKRLNGDALWALRLCRNRVTVSSQGSMDLQITVLQESAQTALQLHCNDEAVRFTERALTLCVNSRHHRTVTLLLNLCSLYRMLGMNNKAIVVLHEFIKSNAPESSTHEVLYEIALCYLREGNPASALTYFEEASRAAEHKGVLGRCEYGICCCYFCLKNYDESLKHLRRSQELRACSDVNDSGELLQLNDHLEEALIEWFCGDSVHSVETIQEITKKCCDVRVGMALDGTCLYELLDCESLSGVAALHGYMIRGDFTSARRILDTTFNHNRLRIACVLDEAIILWHEHKVEECVTLLRQHLNKHLSDEKEDCQELSLLSICSGERDIVRLLNAILMICVSSMHDGCIESLALAERFFWNDVRMNVSSKPSPAPDLESTLACLNKTQLPLLYRFNVIQFSLLWHATKGGGIRILFLREETSLNGLSLFYAHIFEQVLLSSGIDVCERSEFEHISSACRTLVNVEHCGLQYEHRIALHHVDHPSSTPHIRIGFLTAASDSQLPSIDHVSCINEDDLIRKLQVCSVVVIDCSLMKLDAASILQRRTIASVAVVLNDASGKLPNALLLAGASCVVHISDCCCQHITDFLCKVFASAFVAYILRAHLGNVLSAYVNVTSDFCICHLTVDA